MFTFSGLFNILLTVKAQANLEIRVKALKFGLRRGAGFRASECKILMSELSTSRQGFLAKSGAILASLVTFGFLRSAYSAPASPAALPAPSRKVVPATGAVPRPTQR
jgi:hypothetical protein